jgi:hypothetical protein
MVLANFFFPTPYSWAFNSKVSMMLRLGATNMKRQQLNWWILDVEVERSKMCTPFCHKLVLWKWESLQQESSSLDSIYQGFSVVCSKDEWNFVYYKFKKFHWLFMWENGNVSFSSRKALVQEHKHALLAKTMEMWVFLALGDCATTTITFDS